MQTTTNPTTELLIDVQATLANIFGCHEVAVPELCQISDWAANTKAELETHNETIQLGDYDHNDVARWLNEAGDVVGENDLWRIPRITEMVAWVEA